MYLRRVRWQFAAPSQIRLPVRSCEDDDQRKAEEHKAFLILIF